MRIVSRAIGSYGGLCGFLALAGTLLAPASAPAEVRIKTLADGTKMIYNESREQRARRTSGRLHTPPRTYLALIERHARSRGLDPRLVQAVVQVESGYNALARSTKGAMGLMQLMPATARELRVDDPWDADQNVRGGTLYLRRLLDRYRGDTTLALAAYNAGPGAVDRHGGVPPYRETRGYVDKINGLLHGIASSRPARATAKPTAPAKPARHGLPVYVVRDEQNRIVFTTKAPAGR